MSFTIRANSLLSSILCQTDPLIDTNKSHSAQSVELHIIKEENQGPLYTGFLFYFNNIQLLNNIQYEMSCLTITNEKLKGFLNILVMGFPFFV